MGVMPFMATCHACELFYCMILVFLFEWRIKFSLSLLIFFLIVHFWAVR